MLTLFQALFKIKLVKILIQRTSALFSLPASLQCWIGFTLASIAYSLQKKSSLALLLPVATESNGLLLVYSSIFLSYVYTTIRLGKNGGWALGLSSLSYFFCSRACIDFFNLPKSILFNSLYFLLLMNTIIHQYLLADSLIKSSPLKNTPLPLSELTLPWLKNYISQAILYLIIASGIVIFKEQAFQGIPELIRISLVIGLLTSIAVVPSVIVPLKEGA